MLSGPISLAQRRARRRGRHCCSECESAIAKCTTRHGKHVYPASAYAVQCRAPHHRSQHWCFRRSVSEPCSKLEREGLWNGTPSHTKAATLTRATRTPSATPPSQQPLPPPTTLPGGPTKIVRLSFCPRQSMRRCNSARISSAVESASDLVAIVAVVRDLPVGHLPTPRSSRHAPHSARTTTTNGGVGRRDDGNASLPGKFPKSKLNFSRARFRW